MSDPDCGEGRCEHFACQHVWARFARAESAERRLAEAVDLIREVRDLRASADLGITTADVLVRLRERAAAFLPPPSGSSGTGG